MKKKRKTSTHNLLYIVSCDKLLSVSFVLLTNPKYDCGN